MGSWILNPTVFLELLCRVQGTEILKFTPSFLDEEKGASVYWNGRYYL